jgi:hypothetical protein
MHPEPARRAAVPGFWYVASTIAAFAVAPPLLDRGAEPAAVARFLVDTAPGYRANALLNAFAGACLLAFVRWARRSSR